MSQTMSPDEWARAIKVRAAELGFAACGIADAAPSASHAHYLRWLAEGFSAGMKWIARDDAIEKRRGVDRVLEGAQSVVCVAMHYRTNEDWDETAHGKIARYARGDDYHEFMTRRLRELLSWIQAQTNCAGRVYVDTGPILERELAQRAGIGWVGKNTMILSRELGSYFLLGEILLDVKLPTDKPHIEQFCGSCTRCLDACPTQAFEAPYVLNANKCISYHTIENRERVPRELSTRFGDWLFGCDICQEVCPWNAKSSAHSEEIDLWTRAEMPTLLEMLMSPPAELSPKLKGSPLKRAKRRGLKRNALNVLKNRRSSTRR